MYEIDWPATLQALAMLGGPVWVAVYLIGARARRRLEVEVSRYKLASENAVNGWNRSLVQVQKMPHAVALAFKVRDCRPMPDAGRLVSPEYVQAWTEFVILAKELSSKSPQDFHDELLKL